MIRSDPTNLIEDETKRWLLSPEGDGSPLFQYLLAHLERDSPDIFTRLREWQEAVLRLLHEVAMTQERFYLAVHRKVVEQKVRVEGIPEPGPNDLVLTGAAFEFAFTLWDAIARDYRRGGSGFSLLIPHTYFLGEADEGESDSVLFCNGREIALGPRRWVKLLQELHEKLYDDLGESLWKELEQRGVLRQIESVTGNTKGVEEGLDALSLGGALFTPGGCRLCIHVADADGG